MFVRNVGLISKKYSAISQEIEYFNNYRCENLESHMHAKYSLIDSNRKIAVYIINTILVVGLVKLSLKFR
jgi:hypothetical protein